MLLKNGGNGVTGARSFLRKAKIYPLWFQIAFSAGLLFIVFHAAFGIIGHWLSVSTTWWIWRVFWPVLPLIFLLTGKLWCSVCPHTFLSSILKKLFFPIDLLRKRLIKHPSTFSHDRPVSSKNAKAWGLLVTYSLITFLFIFPITTEVPYEAEKTVIIFSFWLAIGFLVNILFSQKTFCRHVCPMGLLSRTYSAFSLTRIQTDRTLCSQNPCKQKRKAGVYNGAVGNKDFDEECVKNCNQHLSKFVFKPPLINGDNSHTITFLEAMFPSLLLVVFFTYRFNYFYLQHLHQRISGYPLVPVNFHHFLVGIIFSASLFVILLGLLIYLLAKKKSIDTKTIYTAMFALTPLCLLFHLYALSYDFNIALVVPSLQTFEYFMSPGDILPYPTTEKLRYFGYFCAVLGAVLAFASFSSLTRANSSKRNKNRPFLFSSLMSLYYLGFTVVAIITIKHSYALEIRG